MERPEILQKIFSLFPEVKYLEIGVSTGATFHEVQAKQKYAVDPNFLFDISTIPNSEDIFYFPVTSDSFFESFQNTDKFQVIYIDGLHTFEKTLRDLLNSIQVLAAGGVIIIDDTVPTSYEASLPSSDTCFQIRKLVNNGDSAWMGDVYKLAFFIQTFMQQFEYRTINDNHGQIVMWHQPRRECEIVSRKMLEISQYDFSDTITRRDNFKFASLEEIISLLRNALNKGQR